MCLKLPEWKVLQGLVVWGTLVPSRLGEMAGRAVVLDGQWEGAYPFH